MASVTRSLTQGSPRGVRPKPSSSAKRTTSLRASVGGDGADACRVRVAVRLRPRNADDLPPDGDYADCVELQPEMRRLKLRKNNWISGSYKFDEVFAENASQKRVYEVVAKPVVESVLCGFNGTIMAYGQTGTGKTYTIGRLGDSDQSERGIMVRAMEHILTDTSAFDVIAVSYFQLYLESIQDLLTPEKKNITIAEDPKTGEVSLPGAEIVTVKDLDHFLHLLRKGAANRRAANTKLNTESSRSHAVLMVYIRRSSKGKEEKECSARDSISRDMAIVNRSKLLIVDLAGSERIDKSGSDGHLLEEAKFINLSLTSLGKCINALSENSPHVPTRDSKLTRLLRDSFGGSSRTSLIITIGPSVRHYAETASTIVFGQRAMKIVNALKLKVELDYESQCRGLQEQVDSLTKELERQQYLRKKEKKVIEEELKVCEVSLGELESSLTLRYEECQLKVSAYQKDFTETSQMYEKKLADLERQLEDMRTCENSGDQRCLCENEKLLQQYQLECSTYQKVIVDTTQMYEKIIADLSKQLEHMHASYGAEYLTSKQQYAYDNEETNQEVDEIDVSLDMTDGIDNRLQEIEALRLKLQDMSELNEKAVVDIQSLEAEKGALTLEKGLLLEELSKTQLKLMEEERQKRCLEDEMNKLKKSLVRNSVDEEVWSSLNLGNTKETTYGFRTQMSLPKSRETKETKQRETIAKILEEVGVRNILVLLKSEDLDILVHAIKAVANLAAEDLNQEEIVREGGLDALLLLIQSSQDAIVQRIASGAIANLAMNGMNQEYIVQKGGAQLLADVAFRTDDPQTMRMVAGAIANLCGNEKVHLKLKEDGGTKALLAMARSGRSDVIAQVARGLANFSKCESRGITRGWTKGKSLLIDDGALGWLISNSATASGSTRRHIDLAICHLAQNGNNASDIVSSGGIKELVRLSQDSTREDISSLATKTLNLNPTLLAEMQKCKGDGGSGVDVLPTS